MYNQVKAVPMGLRTGEWRYHVISILLKDQKCIKKSRELLVKASYATKDIKTQFQVKMNFKDISIIWTFIIFSKLNDFSIDNVQ